MRVKIILLCFVFLSATSTFAQTGTTEFGCDSSKVKFRAVAEIGFISVLSHKIQLGEGGTYFNYVTDGGQDVLFPSTRL